MSSMSVSSKSEFKLIFCSSIASISLRMFRAFSEFRPFIPISSLYSEKTQADASESLPLSIAYSCPRSVPSTIFRARISSLFLNFHIFIFLFLPAFRRYQHYKTLSLKCQGLDCGKLLVRK